MNQLLTKNFKQWQNWCKRLCTRFCPYWHVFMHIVQMFWAQSCTYLGHCPQDGKRSNICPRFQRCHMIWYLGFLAYLGLVICEIPWRNSIHLVNLPIIRPKLDNLAKLIFFTNLWCIPPHMPNNEMQSINPDLNRPGSFLPKTHLE